MLKKSCTHRSADETLFAELMPSLHGIHYASKHLKGWMKPSRRAVGIAFQPASAKVIYQPLGVVGVIVPWNYPLYLAIGPLVGALAAGNRVMLKLSESTPATGELLKTLLAKIFPEDLVRGEVGCECWREVLKGASGEDPSLSWRWRVGLEGLVGWRCLLEQRRLELARERLRNKPG